MRQTFDQINSSDVQTLCPDNSLRSTSYSRLQIPGQDSQGPLYWLLHSKDLSLEGPALNQPLLMFNVRVSLNRKQAHKRLGKRVLSTTI